MKIDMPSQATVNAAGADALPQAASQPGFMRLSDQVVNPGDAADDEDAN